MDKKFPFEARHFENAAFNPGMIAILVLFLFGNPTSTTNDAAFANTMMAHVNHVRTHGCTCNGKQMAPVSTVQWHEKLEITATLHARQMVKYRFFEHYSAGGMDIGERATKVGYHWRTIGENLARGQADIPSVIKAWIKSPTHCEVLMNPKFREMGAARVGEYWVLHMGVRK